MATAITFNEQQFEKRLLSLKDTQESISTLSSWCLQQHQHHKKIVSLWLQVLKKVKIEQRLTLFYLANDVIQYSKRKGYDFVESWGTALQRATTMVRDDKVKNKILRLFKIWDERSIYDEAFLVDLSGLLSSRGPARSNSQEAQDFQPPVLIAKIRSCKELEDDTDFKLKVVNESHLSLSDADAMRSSLKDRKHGADIEAEVDDGIGKMNDYIDALKAEIKERASVIELLDHAEAFYENQRGEAKIVCNAYRNFGTRVKALKRKLDELITTLPSPIPSPDVDAPSPSPESDIDLPEENSSGKCYSTSASFIGSLVMPDKVRLSESTPEKSGGTSSSSSTDYDSPKHTYRPPTPPNRKYPQKPSPKPAKSPSPKYQTPTKQVTPEPYRPVITTTAPPAPYSVKPNNKTTSHTGTIKSSYEPVPSSTYQTTKTTSQSYTAPVTTSSAVTTSYLPNSNSSPIYSPTYPPTTYSSNTAPKYTSNNSHSYPPVTPPPYTGSYPPTTTTTQSYLPNNIPTYPTSSDPLVNTNYNSTPPFPPPDYSLPPPIVHNQHTTHTPDYSVPPPNPFYQSSNTTMPPLLGEDFPVNGTDSFLQQPPPPQSSSKRESSGSNLPGLGSGFSTFMGSSNLPFDIQKGGIFSDTSCDTPASPIAEHSVDDNSQNYLSDSNTTTQVSGQGKPIEVISMSTPTDISEILKALGMPTGGRGTSTTNSTVSPTSSVGPRPVTSNVLDDVYQEEELEKHWNQPPLLPSKFPTWGQPDWVDTPTSPPPYEKSGYVDPVEYDESDSLILAEQDTDLRSLAIDRVPHGDIDHRNLISLTSSPREETCWSSSKDTDYRRIALVSKAGAQDNVESVDMEMSSEEEMDNMTTTTTTAAAATVGLAEVVKAASMSTTTVSFSLNTNTKVLPESPLIEKEEVKPKKPPPKLDILTPPHDLLSDPPLVPDVAEIFPELLDSNDSGVADEPDNNTVPLLPPPPPAPLAIPIPKAAPPAITIPKTAPPAIPIPKAAPPAIPIPTAAPPALPIPKVEDIKKINKVVEEFQSPAPPPLPLGPPPFMHPPQHRMKVNFINTRPPPPPPPPPPPRFFPRRGNFRHCGPRFRPPPPSMPPQQPPPGPPVQMDMSFRGRPPFRPPWRPRFPTCIVFAEGNDNHQKPNCGNGADTYET